MVPSDDDLSQHHVITQGNATGARCAYPRVSVALSVSTGQGAGALPSWQGIHISANTVGERAIAADDVPTQGPPRGPPAKLRRLIRR